MEEVYEWMQKLNESRGKDQMMDRRNQYLCPSQYGIGISSDIKLEGVIITKWQEVNGESLLSSRSCIKESEHFFKPCFCAFSEFRLKIKANFKANHHQHVFCDGCDKSSFDGIRYACKICINQKKMYDLCQECYDSKVYQENHCHFESQNISIPWTLGEIRGLMD